MNIMVFIKSSCSEGKGANRVSYKAGILDSYFVRRIYSITHTHCSPLTLNHPTCNLVLFVILVSRLFLYHLARLQCITSVWCFFSPPRQNHWSFCKGSCYGKLSQPISNHECMRTPAGRLSTLFACVASLSGRLINQLSWLVAGLGFIRYSSGCVFIRSKQDKDTAEMQLAIVFFIDTPSSLVVHHNLEAQIFSYP